ncbi:hypothetical protein [Xanthomonas arboricola]|uniref:hypothetical protein n=1 Tax=Xanthomonas arboricola TaxID=56448 RepID=UPI0011B0A2A3|nr:hypothetical protein [Xanthomonas arboricola]
MRLLIRSIAVLTLSLGTLACAQGPASDHDSQEKTMEGNPPSAADVRSEQDKAAAIADRAADEASRRAAPNAVVLGDYPSLPQGPALTSGALVEAIVRMAKSFETRADMAPMHVAQVSGLEVTPDSQGRRTGLQGALGVGHYEFAVWKPYARHPGHTIELAVRPSDACDLSFKSLYDPLVAAGFGVTKSAVGFKPTVYFERALADGLGLYVVVSTDKHDDPRCVSRVRLEMEPRDG